MESYVKNSSMINILKGVGIAFAFTIIALVILSAVLTYTQISESFIEPAIIIITAISILIGSSIGNLKIKKNGILNGAMVAFFYMIIIYLISSIMSGSFAFHRESIIMILVGMVFGIFGGIIGVNRK